MNKQVEDLQALTREQRELIKKLVSKNRHLSTLTQTLRNRIQDLEQQHIVIDREIAEIPIGFDLIPEDDLNRY
jgi:predicted  nucleic acid-binding Zn-ribbon protein